MSLHMPNGGSSSLVQYVGANYTRLEPLLEFDHDEEFSHYDLPEHLRAEFAKLRENRIIVHGTKLPNKHWTWRINPTARGCLERLDHDPSGPLTPCCGYDGFKNLREGGFECVICGDEFDRDEFVMAD